MNREKEAMIEALIRYYLIELFNYNNTGMFEDIDAILHNLNNNIFDKRDFDYESFADKHSHVTMLRDLLLSYQNSEGICDSPKDFDAPEKACETCECMPCDCGWGS